MPRSTYIPVKSRTIGRGKHMDSVVLKKVLLFACNHRPCELEKVMGLKHGTAVRACAKVVTNSVKMIHKERSKIDPPFYKTGGSFDNQGDFCGYFSFVSTRKIYKSNST